MNLTSRGSNPGEAASLASALYNLESTVCFLGRRESESWGRELPARQERQGCRYGEREGIPGRGNRVSKGTEVGKDELLRAI